MYNGLFMKDRESNLDNIMRKVKEYNIKLQNKEYDFDYNLDLINKIIDNFIIYSFHLIYLIYYYSIKLTDFDYNFFRKN